MARHREELSDEAIQRLGAWPTLDRFASLAMTPLGVTFSSDRIQLQRQQLGNDQSTKLIHKALGFVRSAMG